MSALSRFGVSREPRFDVIDDSDGTLMQVRGMVASRKPIPAPEVSIAQPEVPQKLAGKSPQSRDFSIALGLLEKATSGVDDLFSRFQQSESAREQAAYEIERYKERELQWNADMEAVKTQFQELEGDLASISERLIDETARATACEAKLAETEAALKAERQRNSELENDCIALHDSILGTFGVGSETYKMLDSLNSAPK